MKIIEQFVQSKTSSTEDCEDGIFVGEHYVAVVDGASARGQTAWTGKRSGRIAMELITAAMEKLGADLDAGRGVSVLNEALATWYRTQGLYEQMQQNPLERCSANAVFYSRSRSQIWFLGDCQAMIDGKLIDHTKLVDIVTTNARALFLELALREGKTVADLQEHDTGREFIEPLLNKQSLLQNVESDSEFAFVELDGFFTNLNAIKILEVPTGAKEIVLASDGYPELASTLAESERLLQEVLSEDPLMFRRYKATRGLQKGRVSYDDRAYVRIQV